GQPGHRHTFNPRIPPRDGRDAQLIREAARASLAEGDPSMNTQAKRLYLLLALIPLLFLAAACGGGSAPLPPPPPPAKFSNASLAGQYAFSMTGSELCAGVGSLFTRAGSFTADGHGNITTGLEDINVCTGTATLQFTGGKYSIDGDGRGTLQLTNSTGTTNYSIVLSSTTSGLVAQDRKSTRLNSSHVAISYAVFCLKKKKKIK